MKRQMNPSAQPSNTSESTSQEAQSEGWLLQCPPGLGPVLKKELVFAGCIKRDQQLFVKKQRNHDLLFANHLKSSANHVKSSDRMTKLRIAESVLRCPVYGRFKVSKRQLAVMAEELKRIGPRRLVVSVAGRVFERHDLSRWLTKEISALGYDFNSEVEDEVWMFCIDESWYFGLPIKKGREAEGREQRIAERRGSLPPPIAAAIAFAAMPRPDDVIFDPVCGSGTLLAECHAYSPQSVYIGADSDPEAIAIARQNLRFLKDTNLIQCDSRKTPIERHDVTLVLANLPFGLQYGDKAANPHLYRDLLQEQMRLRDPNKNWRAIVITSDIESLHSALRELPMLSSESLFKVKIRGELAFASRLKFK